MPVYPTMAGQTQVVVLVEGVSESIDVADAWVFNKITLSANQKLRIKHRELAEETDLTTDIIAVYDDDPDNLATTQDGAIETKFLLDQEQRIALVIDLPGRTGGGAMTALNYLSTAAWPNKILPGA